jgi:GNAT superfamily N-acetyltransferase
MLTIRKARLSDVPLLGALEKQFHRNERNAVLKQAPRLKTYIRRTPDRNRKVAGWMRKWIRSKNAMVLLAESDGFPVGFATATIEANQGIYGPSRFGFIGFVFVRLSYRGQGVSSLLMKEMLAWFAKRKIRHVSLTVMEGNRPARDIWKKWGFVDFSVFSWKLK